MVGQDTVGRWVLAVTGSTVLSAEPLTGGVASRMLALRLADGRDVVLRQLVSQPYRRFAEGLLYREAFARLRRPAPTYAPTFLHRDYHPANVLVDAVGVTGVVDWVETSTGPADLDVAHCASHLAGLFGADAALAFRRAYVDRGRVLAEDPDDAAYGQVLDLVGFLPDGSGRESGAPPDVIEAVWAAAGRGDLTVDLARSRREELLRATLA